MEKLFSYGTLKFEHVQIETFGRKLDGEEDALIGYKLCTIKIKDKAIIKTSGTDIHPILKFTGNNTDLVEGIIFELTTSELQQADNYEVEEHKRILGNFHSGNKAWVYVCAATELTKKIR